MSSSSRYPLMVAAFVVTATACASGGSSAAGNNVVQSGNPRADRSRMDTLEFRNKSFRTIYDAIRATHPDWLNVTGGSTSIKPSGQNTPTLGIFIEGQNRSQPMEYLTRLTPEEVISVRRISASEALSMYGWPWTGVIVTPGR